MSVATDKAHVNHSNVTSNSLYQMNEKNLGVCFAPSLFHLCGTKEDPSSPKRQKRTPMNKASKELTDNLVRISTTSPQYLPDPSCNIYT